MNFDVISEFNFNISRSKLNKKNYPIKDVMSTRIDTKSIIFCFMHSNVRAEEDDIDAVRLRVARSATCD